MAESIRERMTVNPRSLECGSTVMATRAPKAITIDRQQHRGGKTGEVVEGIST
jgi:translation initiation factor 1 (eIF-1/SUI1)